MGQFIQLDNFSKIVPYAQLFRQGMLVTILLSLFTVVIGFCIALVLALMRMSNVCPFRSLGLDKNGHLREGGFLALVSRFNPLSFLATAYVEILRSTPVIVQIFIVYYGVFSLIQLPSFQLFGFIKFDRFFPGVVALGMNSGAYLCGDGRNQVHHGRADQVLQQHQPAGDEPGHLPEHVAHIGEDGARRREVLDHDAEGEHREQHRHEADEERQGGHAARVGEHAAVDGHGGYGHHGDQAPHHHVLHGEGRLEGVAALFPVCQIT